MGTHILWMVTVSGWTTKHINIFHANFYKFEYILDLFLFSVPKYIFKKTGTLLSQQFDSFIKSIYQKKNFSWLFRNTMYTYLYFRVCNNLFMCIWPYNPDVHTHFPFDTHHNTSVKITKPLSTNNFSFIIFNFFAYKFNAMGKTCT